MAFEDLDKEEVLIVKGCVKHCMKKLEITLFSARLEQILKKWDISGGADGN